MNFVYKKDDNRVIDALLKMYGSVTPGKKLFKDLPSQHAGSIYSLPKCHKRYKASAFYIGSNQDTIIAVTVTLPVDGEDYCFLADSSNVSSDYETSVIDNMMYDIPSGELVKFTFCADDLNKPECKCGGVGVVGAKCPFSMEINQVERVCQCCRSCRHECAMDI